MLIYTSSGLGIYIKKLRGWFKGNDTRVLCSFLEWHLARILADFTGHDEAYIRKMWEAAKHVNSFLRGLYSSGLWIPAAEASSFADAGLAFLDRFQDLAAMAYARRVPRYQLVPKLHMMAHVIYDLRFQARKSATVINPMAFSCQADEDFIGKICILSRSCHGKTLHDRTLQKYKVNLAARWWKTILGNGIQSFEPGSWAGGVQAWAGFQPWCCSRGRSCWKVEALTMASEDEHRVDVHEPRQKAYTFADTPRISYTKTQCTILNDSKALQVQVTITTILLGETQEWVTTLRFQA